MGNEQPRFSRRTVLKGGVGLVGASALTGVAGPISFPERIVHMRTAEAQNIPDHYDLPRAPGVPDGHFDTRASGEAPKGYIIVNDEQAPMRNVVRKYGDFDQWGPLVSDRWIDANGRVNQALHKGIFQYKDGHVEWMNILDELERREIDLDNPTDLVPRSFSWDSDSAREWGHTEEGPLPGTIEENHLTMVFTHPSVEARFLGLLKDFYLSNRLWFDQWGLPMSCKDYGPVVVIRCQRAALQLWKEKTDWTRSPMEVVPINGGELAKKYGLIPFDAATPKDNPYGMGGSSEISQNSVEAFLQRTRVSDALVVRVEGRDISIEGRVADGAVYKPIFNSQVKDAWGLKAAEIAKKGGIDQVSIVTVPLVGGNVNGGLAQSPTGGMMGARFYMLEVGGYFGADRSGNKLVIYYAPPTSASLVRLRGKDPDFLYNGMSRLLGGAVVNVLVDQEGISIEEQRKETEEFIKILGGNPSTILTQV